MAIQFILKLIFFYFLYTFLRSVLRSYLQNKTVQNNTRRTQESSQNRGGAQRRKTTVHSEDIIEAEYKVVKEERL